MRRVATLLVLILALVPGMSRAAEPVDMLLVLAADVSRSVTEPKFKLQREGAGASRPGGSVVPPFPAGDKRPQGLLPSPLGDFASLSHLTLSGMHLRSATLAPLSCALMAANPPVIPPPMTSTSLSTTRRSIIFRTSSFALSRAGCSGA